MTLIDNLILRLVERFCHALQRWTGFTSLGVARVGLLAEALAHMAFMVNYVVRFMERQNSIEAVVLSPPLFVFCILSISVIRRAEDAWREAPEVIPAVVAFMRESFLMAMRPMLMCLSGFTIVRELWRYGVGVDFFLECLGLGYAIALYAIAVNPLPPGTNRIREFIESMTFSGSPAPAPAPVR